jgi:hypothetical protein
MKRKLLFQAMIPILPSSLNKPMLIPAVPIIDRAAAALRPFVSPDESFSADFGGVPTLKKRTRDSCEELFVRLIHLVCRESHDL